ncbi:MAG: biotin/lipoyl-containing protein [Candidatus Eisenbacteria bacterium]
MSDSRKYQRFVSRVGEEQRTFDVATGESSSFWVKGIEKDAAGDPIEVSWNPIGHGRVLLRIGGRVRIARIAQSTPQEFVVEMDGRQIPVRADDEITARALLQKASTGVASGPSKILSPMPGTVVNVLVDEGESVAKGQAVIVIEAMKMQNEITAPIAGTVHGLKAAAGQAVEARALLCEIVP